MVELRGLLKHVRVDIRDCTQDGWCVLEGDGSILQPYDGYPRYRYLTLVMVPSEGYDGASITVTFVFGSPDYPDNDFIAGCVREAVMHEAMECIRVDGKPVHDPHRMNQLFPRQYTQFRGVGDIYRDAGVFPRGKI